MVIEHKDTKLTANDILKYLNICKNEDNSYLNIQLSTEKRIENYEDRKSVV